MRLSTETLTHEIFNQPTAPFCEGFVLKSIERIAKSNRLPYFFDKSGNLIVGVSKPAALKKGRRLVLFAHSDHPGFHLGKRLSAREYRASWYGGAPFKTMKGSRVAVYSPHDGKLLAKAIVSEIRTNPYDREGMPMKIRLARPVALPTGSFGGFAFEGISIKNGYVTTRAADDLAGCVMALGAILDQKKNLVCVFTRAEEVGFIGCLALLKQLKFSKDSVAVSLEASRTLPGAELNKGPVLRLGDRSTLFDNDASQYLWWVAKGLQKKNKSFIYQRRIMDGGTCEATALNAYGLRTTGLAVPLDNYHNQGKRGPAPEKIHLRDLDAGRRICAEAARLIGKFSDTQTDLNKYIHSEFKNLAPLLESQVNKNEY